MKYETSIVAFLLLNNKQYTKHIKQKDVRTHNYTSQSVSYM